jgi:uncharacterized membrane protein YccC
MSTVSRSSTQGRAGHAARTSSGAWDELRAGLVALDPGSIALRRGLRGVLSFALTVLLGRGVSALTSQGLVSMSLGFSVSIFGAVVAREPEQRARLLSTCGLIVASGVSFCVSALIRTPWLNHALFIALVFGVVYARRWGDRANAIGFGAFSSFFLAAFLAPSPAQLPWHLLGLALATLAVLAVAVLLLPQRPCASIERAQRAIALQVDRVRALLGRCSLPVGGRSSRSLRRRLQRLDTTIARARLQLDTVTVGSELRDELGFAFFELQAAAENLSGQLTTATEQGEEARALLQPAVAEVEAALRALRDASRSPPVSCVATAPERLAAPAPVPPGIDLHTRLAIQASAACALAIVAGEWLSPQRWYWAVITVFVMFTGTASRGDAIFKSVQRLLGTVLGVLAGMGLVSLVGNEPVTLFSLLLGAIFLTYHSFTERFVAMTFFLTVMLALLFALLGRFSEQLLWLRLEETAVGAVAGVLVAALLVPRPTHSHARDRFIALLGAADDLVSAILQQPLERRAASLGARCRAVVRAQDEMIGALAPFRILPLHAGRCLYSEVQAQLRRCRGSLRALLAAAPVGRPLTPSEAAATEVLRASARRHWGALHAFARGAAGCDRTRWPPHDTPASERPRHAALAPLPALGAGVRRGARLTAADRELAEMGRALDELVLALSCVAATIEQASAPSRLLAHRGPPAPASP